MFLNIIYLIIGILLIAAGADYFIAASSLIAKRFSIPKLVIGLTIVALGTSVPEFGVNILSSINGHSELALGNVLGSNIANILFIFAAAALFIKKIVISKNSVSQISLGLLISLLIFTLSVFSFSSVQSMKITQFEGLALLIFGLFYWLYLYKITKANTERLEVDDLDKNKLRNIESSGLVIAITIISLVILLYGSNIVIESAVSIAQSFGISELIIAGTIIAIGTSLPELAASIQAVRQKQFNLMIGNIVGSNIVNTLFILGSSIVIHAIPITRDAMLYLSVNILASALLLIGFTLFESKTFKRWQAVVLIALYVVFLVTNFVNLY